MFEREYEVDLTILDPIYHHMHHAQTLYLLERARLEMMEKSGFSQSYFTQQHLFPVVSSITVSYLREIRGGPIRVAVESPFLTDLRTIRLPQQLVNERGKLAVRATVDSMIMDGRTKRAIPIPHEFVAALRALS